MEKRMAVIDRRCERCGAMGDASVRQAVRGDALVWTLSFACSVCGNAVEMDGADPMPSDLREAVLAQEGHWELVVEEGVDRSGLLRVLRRHYALSLPESLATVCKLPGTLLTGTRAEVERMARLLRGQRVEALVRRAQTG
jgi:hypothetical protein